MAQRSATEVIIGAAVLVLAAAFLSYAVAHTTSSVGAGYNLTARFDNIAGISSGADVRLGGVKVGSVTDTSLDAKTYQALVTMNVEDSLKLPDDTSAVVTSDGLLGGKYIALQPGGALKNLPPGGQITATQGSISIESLLGKFIFNSASSSKSGDAPAPAAAAAPAAGDGLPPASPPAPGKP
jgi:phospholipid/cholesterol/gamma-HCH transport system substrate-binding protein